MKRQLRHTLTHSASTGLKTLRFILVAVLCLFATSEAFSQAATATWSLTSNANASVTGAVTASAMTTPVGVPTFNVAGSSLDGWNTSLSIDLTDYYEYKVTPTAGNMFQFTGISLFHSINQGSAWVGAIYYSTDNFATAGTQIGSNFAITTTSTSFSVSGLAGVVAPGKTLTVRVYAWNAQNQNRFFRNRQVVISGTTCAGIAFTTQPAGQSICAGSTISLTGAATNTVSYQWKKGGVNISGATAATYTKLNAVAGDSGTYTLDAINACGAVSSTAVTVTVSPPSVGGTTTGGTSVCQGTNSGNITLSGNTGAVAHWESSLDNFATAPTVIANTTTTLSYSNLSVPTYYRAIVTSGACASATSSVSAITMTPASIGGTTAGNATVCATANSGSISLSGNTGSVTGWESSLDNFATAPTSIANTTSTLNYTNLAATTYFRAVVGSCSPVYSTTSVITVTAAPVGGTISGSDTVCGVANSGSLTLSGHTGTIVRWEFSTDNFANATPIANVTATQNYTNLTTTTYYRAVIGNGVCADTYSSVAVITLGDMTIWDGVQWTNGTPTGSKAVTFIANFTSAGDISACSVTITNNAVVTITSGDDFTINGALNIDSGSNMVLQNNANLVQLASGVTNIGDITVNRNSSALKRQDYTMWSSPVTGQNLFDFSPLTVIAPTSRFYTYNTSTNLYNSIASPSSVDFNVGTGYLIRMPNTHPTTATIWNGQFTGVPNNGDMNLTIDNFGAGQRFNLIGNPYPSPIDLFEFVGDNSANITGTLYFWRKTNNALNPSYCTWSTAGFVSNGEDQVFDPQGVLQTGQGFIVEAAGSSTAVAFNNSQRIGNNAGQFFRTSNELEKHRIWLNATNETGAYSQMLVGYMENATTGIDYGIDGKYNNDGPIALNSAIEGEAYTIQGRALPFDVADIVPLTFKATDAGSYTISIDHMDGLFSGSQDVFLKDNLNGSTNDLKLASYTFATEAGTFADRFEIVYQLPLGVSNPSFNENSVVVYANNGNVNISSGSIVMDSVQVFDIHGRLIANERAIDASEISIGAGMSHQVLIVKITSNDNQTVTKKVVN